MLVMCIICHLEIELGYMGMYILNLNLVFAVWIDVHTSVYKSVLGDLKPVASKIHSRSLSYIIGQVDV